MMLGQLRETLFLQRNSWLNYRSLWTSSLNCVEKDHQNNTFHVPQKVEKQSWNAPVERDIMPQNEWRGFFHHFTPSQGITLTIVNALQRVVNFKPSSITSWYRNAKQEANLIDQSYRAERVAVLGYDLAAAHFLVYRGGKIRFKNAQEWTQKDEDGNYDLINIHVPDVFVEALDASGVTLMYEGLENMSNLQHLKWLSVASCQNVDDWYIDRICCQYSDTLEHLDISNCTKVSERGIATLARLRELKSLHLSGLGHIKDIELLCLLLEDVLPNVQITGIKYMKSDLLVEN